MWLPGKRVMIVEDEFLLAMSLEEDLTAAGAIVVGPLTTLSETMEAIEKESFDVAILDVNLNGEMSYPVADALIERRSPFVLLSGYAGTSLPERFRELPRLAKPYDVTRLIEALQAIEIA